MFKCEINDVKLIDGAVEEHSYFIHLIILLPLIFFGTSMSSAIIAKHNIEHSLVTNKSYRNEVFEISSYAHFIVKCQHTFYAEIKELNISFPVSRIVLIM